MRATLIAEIASIRPRHRCRGDNAKADEIYGELQLQFGHGIDAVETRFGRSARMLAERLQFGHGIDAVETMRKAAAKSAAAKLQFGHGIDAVETGNGHGWIAVAAEASIRPRHRCRGDLARANNSREQLERFNSATA